MGLRVDGGCKMKGKNTSKGTEDYSAEKLKFVQDKEIVIVRKIGERNKEDWGEERGNQEAFIKKKYGG